MMSLTVPPVPPSRGPRTPGAGFAAAQTGLIVCAIVLGVATAGGDRWNAGALASIALFTILSDLCGVRLVGSVYISGSLLGIILTAVLFGGGPAGALGLLAICVGWLRSREDGVTFRTNLVTYAWSPLLIGLLFGAVRAAGHIGLGAAVFYPMVFGAYALGFAANCAGIVGCQCFLERGSLREHVRRLGVLLPIVETVSALLTVAAALVERRLGTVGLTLAGLVYVIFQYLAGELLTSRRRGVALHRAATTDGLTGLANRDRFCVIVESRIADSEDAWVVMLMDVDHFKEINDTLGHHFGDALLRDLGPRLARAVGADGVVARLGGDEFGILLPVQGDAAATAQAVARRLFAQLAEPFSIDELSLELTASIGASRYPIDGEDVHALLRCADVAMYNAKEAQSGLQMYVPERNQHSVRRLSVTSEIRHALSSDQIVVHFQPILDLTEMTVRGAEGLVRWEHPEHGLIGPGEFVQTVEQTGLIAPLTRRVLERSIAECAGWRRAGHPLTVSVNLSVRNLLDRELPRQVSELLAAHGLPPDALQLEITESMIMSDPDRALATLQRLSALGVRLSVDDFGTGYSSLAKLRDMPIDELKIDRSFVSPMLRDESDLIIVRSTINLGHDLGLEIIAEGVEDRRTLERLAALGCDLAQGYHLSRPLAADRFRDWLAEPSLQPDIRAARPGPVTHRHRVAELLASPQPR